MSPPCTIFVSGAERITVGSIVARAGVGRSTFYEHFVDKEDVLLATITRPFVALAACVQRDAPALPAVVRVLEHFVENGDRARRLLTGSSRRAVGYALASMIEERLETTRAVERKPLAIAIAEAQTRRDRRVAARRDRRQRHRDGTGHPSSRACGRHGVTRAPRRTARTDAG
jgi:AcrR family transcriptional regulator